MESTAAESGIISGKKAPWLFHFIVSPVEITLAQYTGPLCEREAGMGLSSKWEASLKWLTWLEQEVTWQFVG